MFATDTAGAAAKEAFLAPYLADHLPWLYADSIIWTVVGLVGGACFGIRFVIQWLHSEKAKRVVVPDIFWYLSFVGSIITLVYALHVDRLPIILGLVFSPFLYGRNLVLLHRQRRSMAET
jgi:lipid-A-disaccharide synthase-like uncharacterized protein